MMGHPKPIETGDHEEFVIFKSNRTAAGERSAISMKPRRGASAFDALSRKLDALKALEQPSD